MKEKDNTRKGYRVIYDDINLEKCYPSVAREWDYSHEGNLGLTPSMLRPKSGFKARWICSVCNKGWAANVSDRTANNNGCPHCFRGVTSTKSLAIKRPNVAKTWHPTKNGDLTPFHILPYTLKYYWWKCTDDDCGYEWYCSVARRSNKGGCPVCAGRKVSDRNNLGVKYPEIAKKWHPVKNGDLTPYMVTAHTKRVVWWQCDKCGSEWDSAVGYHVKGYGCKDCCNK